MQDIKDIQDNDKSPLLKAKKTRPPPSEKQKENFQKMAAVRAENIKKRKEEKILEAQQALLAKNGIQVPSAKKEKLKEKQPIQFEIEEQDSGTEEEEIKGTSLPYDTSLKKKGAKETKPITKVKQAKMKPIIEESETDYSSDSSQEVIVIKRGKKKPKAKAQKKERHVEEEDDEEEYLAEPAINYSNYFC